MKDELLKIKTLKEFVDKIKSMGYTERMTKSSHLMFVKDGAATLSIPKEKFLSPGTRRNLVKKILGDNYYAK